MTEPCATPLELEELLAYRRAELAPEREAAVETHYFACTRCAERLTWLERLEEAIVSAMRLGSIDLVVTRRSVERLAQAGGVLRRYDIPAGGSVSCTAAPEDDVAIVTLHPALRRDTPLTLVAESFDPATQVSERRERPIFQDPQTGEVVLAFASEPLRALGYVRVDMSIHAGPTPDGEVLGRFQLKHSPWRG